MSQDLALNVSANTSNAQASMGQLATITEAQMKRIASFVKAATDEQNKMARAVKDAANSSSYQAMADGAKKVESAHAGVNRELLVLGHEISQGNFSRFGGSLLVLAERTNALHFAMSGVGAATIGVGGALLGTLALIAKGAIDADKFAKSMQLTGNYAAVTSANLERMALAQSAQTGQTPGAARGSLDAVAGSGLFSQAEVAAAARAMGDYQRLTGETAADALKKFQSIQDGVARWAAEENKSVHFITLAEYERIKAMEDSGNKQGAAIEALTAYANAIESRGAPSLGILARSWHAVADAASRAAQAIMDVGRPSSTDTRLKDLQDQLADLTKTSARGSAPDMSEVMGRGRTRGDQVASLQRQIAGVQALAAAEQAARDANAKDASYQQLAMDGKAYEENLLRQAHAISERTLELKKWAAQRDADKGAGHPMSAADYASGVAEINKRYSKQPGDAQAKSYQALEASIDAYNERVAQEIAQQDKLSESQVFAIEQHKRLEEASRNLTAAQRADLEIRAQAAAANGRVAEQAKEYRSLAESIQKYNEETRIALGQQKALTEPQKWAAAQHQKVADSPSLSALDRAGANVAIDAGASDREYSDRIDAIKKYAQGIEDAEAQARALLGATADQTDALKKLQGFDNVLGHAIDGADSQSLKRIQEYAAAMRGEVVSSINQTKAAQDALNSSFSKGWELATANFVEQANDQAASAQKIFSDAFGGMANSIAKFAETGKWSIKGLLSTITDDLIRMEINSGLASLAGGNNGGSMMALLGYAASAFGGTSASASLASALPGDSLSNFLALNSNFAGTAVPLASGIDSVPYNGMPAVLHEGERVMTKIENQRSQSGTGQPISIVNNNSFGAGVDASTVAQMVQANGEKVKADVRRALSTNGRLS